ncbi:MarR family transcriptional regulator [Vulcanisaeta sp. SCGC AB-777_J10]|nr:MarR family transcriptional regulator [Vulcanisaeta sp. SCGC AB-777_J10]
MELSDRDRLVLRIVGDHCDRKGQDNIKLEEISERLRIVGISINDAMDSLYRLEDAGLVRLEIVGYSTIIYITEKGKETYRKL